MYYLMIFQSMLLQDLSEKNTQKFFWAFLLFKFSALCFLVILLPQIGEKPQLGDRKETITGEHQNTKLYISILDADLFPGPHSAKNDKTDQTE